MEVRTIIKIIIGTEVWKYGGMEVRTIITGMEVRKYGSIISD